jgi:hypothetical protein
MIREIIRPQNTNFSINIPKNYINRKVEFIMFPIDEKKPKNITEMSKLGGSLNKYANSSKLDLEDQAWELHIMDKYK